MENTVLCGLVSSVVAVVGAILDGTSGRRDRMVVLVIVVVLVVTTVLLVDTDIFLTATNRHDVCILSRQDLVKGAIVLPINNDWRLAAAGVGLKSALETMAPRQGARTRPTVPCMLPSTTGHSHSLVGIDVIHGWSFVVC